MSEPSHWVKFVRAQHHLDGIKVATRRYLEGCAHSFVPDEHGNEKLVFSEQPSHELDALHTLIGECVYQLRSALDHAMYAVIARNPTGISLPNGWDERCEFPIATRLPKAKPVIDRPPVPMPVFCAHYRLPGLTSTAYQAIERMQPYYPGQESGWLSTLARFSNVDKHRHFNLAVAALERIDRIGPPGSELGITIGPFTLRDSAEVPLLGINLVGNMKMERKVTPFVTFDEPNGLVREDAPVDQVLAGMLWVVRNILTMSDHW